MRMTAAEHRALNAREESRKRDVRAPFAPTQKSRSLAELKVGEQGRLLDGHVFDVRRIAAEVSAEGEKVIAVMVTGPRAKELVDVFHADIDWAVGVCKPW